MSSWRLACTVCSQDLAPDYRGFQCVSCGGPLDLQFQPALKETDLRSRESSLWRYRAAIPIDDEEAIVSLGEGLTPVSEEVFDEQSLLLKSEYLSPTGSFKDRGAAVLISRLREMGVGEILEDSSGNAGCSMAAYAASAGITCRVLVPEQVPEEKAIQISHYGAVLERIPGTRDDAGAEALRRAGETFYASHNWQPFFLQGTKTFAYEVFEQTDSLPDVIFYPVGNGSLILGSLKGFNEMKSLGWIDRIPTLIGVQTVSHSPVYTEVTGVKLEARTEQTIAKGIAIRRPVRLRQIAQAIRATSGTAVAVDDSQIREAQKELASRGYLVEPTSAAVFAGYRVWRKTNPGGDERVLLPLTGWGLKDLEALEALGT